MTCSESRDNAVSFSNQEGVAALTFAVRERTPPHSCTWLLRRQHQGHDVKPLGTQSCGRCTTGNRKGLTLGGRGVPNDAGKGTLDRPPTDLG